MEEFRPKNKTLKVRIDGPTYEFLRVVAGEAGLTLSELVRRIIYVAIVEKALKKVDIMEKATEKRK